MKKMYQLMMMFAMMGTSLDQNYGSVKHKKALTDAEWEEIRAKAKSKRLERLKNQGVRLYAKDGISVIARDDKNAIRKINRVKEMLKEIDA